MGKGGGKERRGGVGERESIQEGVGERESIQQYPPTQ